MAQRSPVISVMVAVPNAPQAVEWYKSANGDVDRIRNHARLSGSLRTHVARG